MQCHQARQWHGHTSACVACDELIKLNLAVRAAPCANRGAWFLPSGLADALAPLRRHDQRMPRLQAWLQHGRTRACLAHDELFELNSGRATRRGRESSPFLGTSAHSRAIPEAPPKHAAPFSAAAARPHEYMLRLRRTALA
jgi:hypothetical protein